MNEKEAIAEQQRNLLYKLVFANSGHCVGVHAFTFSAAWLCASYNTGISVTKLKEKGYYEAEGTIHVIPKQGSLLPERSAEAESNKKDG